MECEVSFFGGVLEATGKDSAKVSFTGNTLGDLLEQIRKKWPKTSDFLGGPKSGAVVFVLNGQSLKGPKMATKLSPRDKLSIVHLIAGG